MASTYTGTNLGQVKAGLNALLTPLQTDLDTLVYANRLPLVGDALKDSTDPAVDFLDRLRTAIATLGDDETTVDDIRQVLNEQLGSSGLNWLKDLQVLETADEVTFDLKLGNAAQSIATPINFDIGLPGLGFEVTDDSKVQADLGFDFDLEFSVDKATGFSVDTSGLNELAIDLNVGIPDLKAKGKLGFLQVDIADEDSDSDPTNGGADVDGDTLTPTKFIGRFDIDLTDADGTLTLSDLTSAAPADLVAATLSGKADVNLNLRTSFDGAKVLPLIGTDFNLGWTFTNANAEQPNLLSNFGDAPTVAFNNVSINLGSFFSDFAAPVVDSIQTFTKPLDPIISFLTEDLPLIKQSLLDIASSDLLSPLIPFDISDIAKVVETIDLLASIPMDAGGIDIQLGSFNLGSADVRSLKPGDLQTINPDDVDVLGTLTEQLNALGPAAASTKAYLDQLQGDAGNLQFPIITDPNTVFNLLLGKPDTLLFSYDMPALKFSGGYENVIRILGPLGIRLRGELGANIDLAFGYDVQGLVDFANGGEADKLLNGFYVSDRSNPDGTGDDRPEAEVKAGLEASATIDVVVASADAGGGIYGAVDFDLDDNGDGKFRPATELSGCAFDTTGRVTAGIFARLKIGWGPFSYTKRFDLGSTTLLSFEAGCEDAQDDPTLNFGLALEEPIASGVFQLSMGPKAGKRLIDGNMGKDGSLLADQASNFDEVFAIKPIDGAPNSINVSAFGIVRRYDGVKQIAGDGGAQNDAIVLDPKLLIQADLKGGAGDDQIYGGAGNDVIDGGADDDGLYGNEGDDTINGGEGDDLLDGGLGADTLIGGAGFDTVSYRNSFEAVTFELGTDGFSVGSGGEAKGDRIKEVEFIEGSAFHDTLLGDATANSLEGLSGDDILRGGDNNDFLIGGAGSDTLDGGDSTPVNSGNDGTDTGGDGTSYLTSGAAVTVNLATGFAFGGDATGDTLISIEDVQGSAFNDILIGSSAFNRLDGFFGDDRLTGGAGGDILDGGEGIDWARYNTSPDAVNISLRTGRGTGFGTSNTGGGDGMGDRLILLPDTDANPNTVFNSIENLEGSAFNDILAGDSGNNTLRGLAGDDTLSGDEGDDTLIGGMGGDILDGGSGLDLADYSSLSVAVTVNLAAGTGTEGDAPGDTFVRTGVSTVENLLVSTVENLLGSRFADSLTGDAGRNEIDPGLSSGGIDFVNGGGGDKRDLLKVDYSRNDTGTGVTGGFTSTAGGALSRNQTAGGLQDAVVFSDIERLQFIGTSKADNIRGGADDDDLVTGAGDDVVFGGQGSNRILAEDGDDIVTDQNDQSGEFGKTPNNSFIVLDGGNGRDTLSIDLSGKFDSNTKAAYDIVLESTNPQATNSNQRLTLSDGSVIQHFEVFKNIRTGDGNDRLTQLGRVDNNFSTGYGDDVVTPGLGLDVVDGGFTNDETEDEDDVLVLDYSVEDIGSGLLADINDNNASNNGRYFRNADDGTILDRVDFKNFERFQITGTRQADQIFGGFREDILNGNDGDDFILGNYGNDTINAGAGNDIAGGGEGDDVLFGGEGDDVLFDRTELADDKSTGGGKNWFDGGAGNDLLVGGEDNDTLIGGTGDDTLIGVSSGNFQFYAGEQLDTLTGGAGADQFWLGDDRLVYYVSPPPIGILSLDGGSPTLDDGLLTPADAAYAQITDFNVAEGDKIQLNGRKQSYSLAEFTANGTVSTAIYLGTLAPDVAAPDLIGIVEDASGLSLDANYFTFV